MMSAFLLPPRGRGEGSATYRQRVLQEARGVLEPAAGPDLVVQVNAGGAAGRAHAADYVTGLHRRADAHDEAGEMAIARS